MDMNSQMNTDGSVASFKSSFAALSLKSCPSSDAIPAFEFVSSPPLGLCLSLEMDNGCENLIDQMHTAEIVKAVPSSLGK